MVCLNYNIYLKNILLMSNFKKIELNKSIFRERNVIVYDIDVILYFYLFFPVAKRIL